jgi:hypothetical protein
MRTQRIDNRRTARTTNHRCRQSDMLQTMLSPTAAHNSDIFGRNNKEKQMTNKKVRKIKKAMLLISVKETHIPSTKFPPS